MFASADGVLMAEKRSAHARDKGGTPKRDTTLRARADADPGSTATDREGEGTAAMDAEDITRSRETLAKRTTKTKRTTRRRTTRMAMTRRKTKIHIRPDRRKIVKCT